MRLATLAALAASLVLAGCFAAETPAAEGPGEPPAGGSDEGATPTGEGAQAPSAREPVEVRHDYSAAPETVSFDLVEGFYDVRIGWWAPDTVMGCVSADARVVVTDPAGEVYADLAPSAVQTPCEGNGNGKQSKELLLGGTWTADFTGSGVAVAVITLTPI